MSCVLKPRVSYNKIPKKCFKICNSITRRHKNHKKRHKQISFNIEPPVNSNTSNFESVYGENTSETSTPESTTSETSTPESTTFETSTPESTTSETNKTEPTTETSIINRITNSASSLLGFSNKKGGKSAKKRKYNKVNSSKKRKN